MHLPMDPQLVLFAIQSAVKLGRKLYDVLVDETVERPLLLPLGDLRADVQLNDAVSFFTEDENRHLIQKGGPYFGFNPEQLKLAYGTLQTINTRLDTRSDSLETAAQLISKLHGFRQLSPGKGAKSPAQRILGTVFEIGVDYFLAHPESLGANSHAQRVITSFLQGIDETDFAEGSPTDILGSVLGAALRTASDNPELLGDDRRLQVLFGGLSKGVVGELAAAKNEGERLTIKLFIERVASGLVRGGLAAFDENLDLFLPTDGTLKTLVDSTVSQVLGGVREHGSLFTNETLELVFKSALGAVGENAEIFTDNAFLQQLIEKTLDVLTSTKSEDFFTGATVNAVLRETLEVVRENVETLIDPDTPSERLLTTALSAITESLVTTLNQGGGVKDLLSSRQRIELVRVVFQELAKHPEQLLGDALDEPRRTALAQIIGSAAAALGKDPKQIINGSGFLELIRIVLPVAVHNASGLLDLKEANPRTNLLFVALSQIADTVAKTEDPRNLVSREVFLEIVRRILPLVSANLDALTGKPISETLSNVLALASGPLQSRINGANLPVLVEGLLRQVFQQTLSLAESTAVQVAAQRLLQAA